MQRIPDYNDLYDQYEAEQERRLDKLPVCSCCDEPIQDESAVVFNDEWICDDCLKNYYRRSVEEYIS